MNKIDLDLEKLNSLVEDDNSEDDIEALLEETRYLVEKAKAEEIAKDLTPNDNTAFKGSHFKEDKKNRKNFKFKFDIKNIIKINKKQSNIEDVKEEPVVEDKIVKDKYEEYAPTSKIENKTNIEQFDEFDLDKGLGVPINAEPSIEKYGDIHTPPSKKDEVEYISYEEGIKRDRKKRFKENKKEFKKLDIISGLKKIVGINDNDPLEKERPSLFSFLSKLKKDDNNFSDEVDEQVDISVKEEMEDIFSTSEKTIRLTNTDPLEVEDIPKTNSKIINIENTESKDDDGTKKYQKITVKNLNKKQENNVDIATTKIVNLSNDFDEDDELTLNILFGKNGDVQTKKNKEIEQQAQEILRIQAERIKDTNNIPQYKSLTLDDIVEETEKEDITKKELLNKTNDINNNIKSVDIKETENNNIKNSNDVSKVVAVKKVSSINNTNIKPKQDNKPKVQVKVKNSNDKKAENNEVNNTIALNDKVTNINNENENNPVMTNIINNNVKDVKVAEPKKLEKTEKIIDTSLKLIKDKEKEIVGTNGYYPKLDNDTENIDNIFVNDLTKEKTASPKKELPLQQKQDNNKATNIKEINSDINKEKSDIPIKMKPGGNMPKYTIPSEEETIVVTVGSFAKTVSFEYDNYKKISKPKKDKSVISNKDNIISIDENKDTNKEKNTVKNNSKKNNKSKFNKKKADVVVDNSDPVYKEFKEDIYLEIEDYHTPEDKDTIINQLKSERSSLFYRSISMTVITIALVIYMIINHFTGNIFSYMNLPYYEYYGITMDLVFIILSVLVSRKTIINGFNGFFTFQGNADVAVSFAIIMVGLQDLSLLFLPEGYRDGTISLYSVLALVALTINTYGKFMIAKRVHDNFGFVSSDKPKYAAKIYDKQPFANALVSGTAVHKPYIAYQRRTGFLKDFLKLSYKPDSLEILSGRISNIGIVLSLLVGLIYGFVHKDFVGLLSAATLCSCAVIPVCNIFGFNVQLNKICSESLEDDAMLIGTEGVKQFCDSNAVMLDVRDLYTEKYIKCCGFHSVNNSKQDDCIKYAAALSLVIESPLCEMFMKMVKRRSIILPNVDKEHTKYESNKGIIGWVDGKRAFLGNKDLMTDYGINIPEFDYDSKYAKENKNVVYVAVSGNLLGMFVVDYKPNEDMVCEMQRMENNGISFLIRTTDPNITADKIMKDFNVYLRSIKILSVEFGNACKKERDTKDEATRAYMVTRGKVSAFCRVLSACVNLKSKMTIVKSLQMCSVILGTFLVILLSLMSGISALGVVKPLLYMLAWVLAIWLLPKINKL